MHSLSKKVFFANYTFHVSESVYEPAEDSFLFAENLKVPDGASVIDMGTGCGILGIIAAENASKVVAVDINPHAVRCTKKNAKLNNVENKMFFLRGDLFTPIKLGEKFDLILFNAPYLPSESLVGKSWLEQAWTGGVNGRELIDRFINEVPQYLEKNGCALLMQSSLSNVDETLRKFEENGLKAVIIAEQDVPFFETIVLVKAQSQT
ncbi:50S ribosomal protein L11 methyltransferase [Candidatus Bathyarchaeota archaeon]|nr:50S ribosomal protein L11 methyltransferase [Candidatus Bathyarchaeota archaeon]